jgi:hypothetical protein
MTVPARANRIAAIWHLLTALIAVAAIVTQFVLVLRGVNVLVVDGKIPSVGTRVVRFFSYFTVQSNILVAITASALAVGSDRDGPVFRVVRLASLFGITVTFATYVTLLRPIVNLHGLPALTDTGLHYVVPAMAVLGWLVFGPRRRITEHTLMLSLIWPVAYVGYTLAHGATTHWYPYPFVDVTKLGYATALRNGLGLTVLLVGVGSLFMYLDHRLSRDSASRS